MSNTRKYIINIVISLIFITLAVLCFLKANEYYILEMQEQISQMNFYKSDIVLLVENNIKMNRLIIGGAISSIVAASIWFDLL